MSSADVFHEITAALGRAQIPYMVVGSFASNLYGTGRATQDIDLVVQATPEQVAELLSVLPKTTYYFDLESALEAARRGSMFNILDTVRGWKIDLIFQKPGAYHREAFQRRIPAEVEGVPVMAATAEDVVISKLDWAKMGESLRQIDDVAGVLKVRSELLDGAYIERWVKDLQLTKQWAAARKAAGLE
jgi:hypothetical protein